MNWRPIVLLAAVLLGFVALPGFAADTWYITTVAGTGKAGYSGDGGPATEAMFNFDCGALFITDSGIIYASEGGNHRIRRIDSAGIVTTIAGNGVPGFSGDGGPATKASLNIPGEMALDRAGNLYIADGNNHRIRKVDAAGIITTIAGTGKAGYSGDGGPATQAELNNAGFLLLDDVGNIYIADYDAFVIRKIDASGIITTVAGTGQKGYSGDGGPATKANLDRPAGMCFDKQGNLYFAEDARGHLGSIRKVDTSGIITTAFRAGGWDQGDGPLAKAHFSTAVIAIDPEGNLIFASGSRIRKIDTATGMISTIAGMTFGGYSGDGGPATEAKLTGPTAVELAADGAIYFTEYPTMRIRKLYRP